MNISKIVMLIGLLHSTGSSTPTSYALAQEMIRQLDIDWSRPDLKFLDPACGRGTFLLALFEKLQNAGHDPAHIVGSMLWEEQPYTDISANLKPSGELPLHLGLQRKMGQHSDEVRVVVHLHPTYCIAAMHAGVDLSTVSAEFPELNRYTRVAPNVGDVAPISQELANQCHKQLQLDNEGNIAYDIVGIKGHGVVAIDTSPWRAYEHIERLEHICKIVLASGKY